MLDTRIKMKEFKVKDHASSLLPDGYDWELVWADEFDGTELDKSKWDYRLCMMGKRQTSWSKEGVELDGNSNLVFTIFEKDGEVCSTQLQTGYNFMDEPWMEDGSNYNGGLKWPIGKLREHKFVHKYGYYEARVKFQKRPFWWSAFWIQSPNTGSTCDPATSGVECDIIENFGDGTLTSGGIYGGYGKDFHDDSARIHYPYTEDDQFHRVGMEWSPEGYV